MHDETPQAQAWRMFFDEVNASAGETPEIVERINFVR